MRLSRGLLKNSSGGDVSTILPASMKMTRSATWRAKPISARDAHHGHSVARELRHRVQNLPHQRQIVEPVGSSNSMVFGFMQRDRAIATRCCWPPDNWLG